MERQVLGGHEACNVWIVFDMVGGGMTQSFYRERTALMALVQRQGYGMEEAVAIGRYVHLFAIEPDAVMIWTGSVEHHIVAGCKNIRIYPVPISIFAEPRPVTYGPAKSEAASVNNDQVAVLRPVRQMGHDGRDDVHGLMVPEALDTNLVGHFRKLLAR